MKEEILEWAEYCKKEHGDVYLIEIAQQSFLYRVINRQEYKEIYYADLDSFDFSEEIAKVGTLYPQSYDFSTCAAGIPEVLCDKIMEISYLKEGQAKEVLDFFRSEMEIFDYQADCMIHEAFPEFKLEDIEKFNVEQTLFYLSRAEYILNTFRGVPIVQIGEKEERSNEIYNEQKSDQTKQIQENKVEHEMKNKDMTFEQFQKMPELNWFSENELLGE
jgi:hypothetical protein